MKEQEMIDVAAVVTTLAEFDGPVIASTVYMALGCDHSRYERTTYLCAVTGLIVKGAETLTITDKGRKIAEQLNAVLTS